MIRHIIVSLLFLALPFIAFAQNPIICDRYTPDPAPYVHNDTLYLFVDHDEDVTLNGYFTMKDWLLYSTVDMVNWTYRGTPLTSKTFSAWAKQDNDCWASQCIERNGKWYWYVTATIKGEAYPGIGVAVADSPAGPYKDPIRKPLVKGWFKIDPTVFIDDNNQAYLFYGNNMLWYTKLTRSMTAISGGEIEVKTKDESAFGPFKGYEDNGTPKTNFEEASWIYKRNGKYYLEYAAGGVPEYWAYSTADKITGPWTYQGKIMGQADGSFTIHGGSVEFRGHHYMFYHNEINFNDQIYVTSARHKNALEQALSSLKLVQNSIAQGLPEDFFSIDLQDAYQSLGEITGETVGDDVIDRIFERFCTGK